LRVEGDEVKHIRKVASAQKGERFRLRWFSEGISGNHRRRRAFLSCCPDSNRSPIEKGIQLRGHLGPKPAKGREDGLFDPEGYGTRIKEIIPCSLPPICPSFGKVEGTGAPSPLEKIAIEASKQCGRTILPRSTSSRITLRCFNRLPGLHSPHSLGEGRSAVERAVCRRGGEEQDLLRCWTGGGLSQEEVDEAKRSGFVPVTLGRRILRSETASLSLLSILQYEWGDIG